MGEFFAAVERRFMYTNDNVHAPIVTPNQHAKLRRLLLLIFPGNVHLYLPRGHQAQ